MPALPDIGEYLAQLEQESYREAARRKAAGEPEPAVLVWVYRLMVAGAVSALLAWVAASVLARF